jgi:predicted DCC family thiol-disulfide oxidoreductase YuxK
MPRLKQYEIFTDGGCPFCQWARARVEPFDTNERLKFLDYNDPAVAAQTPFSREELDREMHVRAPDGMWHAGFAAWVAVLRALPLLSWLGALLGSGLFRKSGPRLYRWVARNRYRLPGSPPPCRADACRVQPATPTTGAERRPGRSP